jgi:hypothetical protein
MKKIIFIIVLIVLFSCEEKKPEFIQSKTITNLILLKNPPKEDSLTKNLIKYFLLKNPPKHEKTNSTFFYKYSSNTKYFLNHKEDPGGFSSEELNMYQDDDGIGVFGFIKCEKDSSKKVGIIRFYDKYGSFYKPDTIINKCN